MDFKNIAVYGIYPSRPMVEQAVEKLKNAGFRNTDISVLFPESEGTKAFAIEKKTKSPEGLATGAGTGAVVGGTLGWLMGIGSLAIPGLGLFIAAGPIMAVLAGVGAGGLVGGIAGALIGMGIPEYEANRYENRIKEGGILLSVHADDRNWIKKGKDILEHTGAEDIGYKGDFESAHDELSALTSKRPVKKSTIQTAESPVKKSTIQKAERPVKKSTIQTAERSRKIL